MNLTVAPAPHLRRTGLVITIVSLVGVAFGTLMPGPADDTGSHFCLVCGSVGGVSAVLNVFLFVPLGIGVALSGWSTKRAIMGMCALSVLIETAQLWIPGRDSTIGDVLTNTVGGALGFAICRYAFTLLRPSPRVALALGVGWSAVWLAVQTISAFGLSPAIPRSEYYGEIAPRVGNFDQFRGRVLRASLADIGVPDARFENKAEVRELLLRGATVTTTVVPSNATDSVAPIVRVADAREREIVLLGQSGEDLVFGVRTGAGVLRLRPLFFAVASVFPAVSTGNHGAATDTVTVAARYSAREVRVNTQAAARARRERRIPVNAALGWTMLLPFQWYIEGTSIELVLSSIWIAFLVFPLGYWGVAMTRPPEGRDATRIRMTVVSVTLMLLYAGLVIVPRSFGASAAPLSDWLAALAGVFSGAALASRPNVSF